MSYSVSPGNFAGRIGSGLGQGISEQIPKETEHYRLSQGLKQLGQQKNLSPMEFATQAASIYGMTPEMQRQFGQLAREQNIRSTYGKGRQGLEDQIPIKPQPKNLQDIQFANLNENQPKKGFEAKQTPVVNPEDYSPPQIVGTNPLREERVPKMPWTSSKRDEDISNVWNQNPSLTFEQAKQISADNEARDLATPEVEKQRDVELEATQKKLRDKFTDVLETKLQKKGEEVYSSVSGEDIANIHRGMERDLASNPNASVDDVVNDWTNRALNLAKAKTQLNKLANTSNWAFPILTNKEGYRNKLAGYQDIYAKAGNLEEYWNTLKSDFGMSPQGAAKIAYPLSPGLKKYTDSVKPQSLNDPSKYIANSKKKAIDIEKNLTSNDSLLALAWDFKQKDPSFDDTAFFKQLLDDQNDIPFNGRQKREIAEGHRGIIPNWADVLILPFFRGIQ